MALPLAKSASNKMCLANDRLNAQHFHYVSSWHDLAGRASPTIAWHRGRMHPDIPRTVRRVAVCFSFIYSTNSFLGLLLLFSMNHTGTQRARFDYSEGRIWKKAKARIVELLLTEENIKRILVSRDRCKLYREFHSGSTPWPCHRFYYFPSGRAALQMYSHLCARIVLINFWVFDLKHRRFQLCTPQWNANKACSATVGTIKNKIVPSIGYTARAARGTCSVFA